MEDQRRFQRATPEEVVKVHDSLTGEVLGQIGNLSANGMMLITDTRIEEDRILQIHFGLVADGEKRTVNVGVRSLWLQTANIASRFWVGLEIIDISDEDEAFLADFAE